VKADGGKKYKHEHQEDYDVGKLRYRPNERLNQLFHALDCVYTFQRSENSHYSQRLEVHTLESQFNKSKFS
jgi:hypothetical protein